MSYDYALVRLHSSCFLKSITSRTLLSQLQSFLYWGLWSREPRHPSPQVGTQSATALGTSLLRQHEALIQQHFSMLCLHTITSKEFFFCIVYYVNIVWRSADKQYPNIYFQKRTPGNSKLSDFQVALNKKYFHTNKVHSDCFLYHLPCCFSTMLTTLELPRATLLKDIWYYNTKIMFIDTLLSWRCFAYMPYAFFFSGTHYFLAVWIIFSISGTCWMNAVGRVQIVCGIESTPRSFHRAKAEVTLEADKTGLQTLHQGNLLAIFSLYRLRGLSAGLMAFTGPPQRNAMRDNLKWQHGYLVSIHLKRCPIINTRLFLGYSCSSSANPSLPCFAHSSLL